jgi:hypothetical protein
MFDDPPPAQAMLFDKIRGSWQKGKPPGGFPPRADTVRPGVLHPAGIHSTISVVFLTIVRVAAAGLFRPQGYSFCW